jgi:hypothetical protein
MVMLTIAAWQVVESRVLTDEVAKESAEMCLPRGSSSPR